MKYKSLLVLACVALMAMSSCKKDSEGNVINYTLTAKINSTATTFTTVSTLTNKKINIIGTSVTAANLGQIIDITIYGDSVGTYTQSVLPFKSQCLCINKESLTALETGWFTSTSGTVNLTNVNKTDKTISGTFEFTLYNLKNTKTISSGVFSNLGYTATN